MTHSWPRAHLRPRRQPFLLGTSVTMRNSVRTWLIFSKLHDAGVMSNGLFLRDYGTGQTHLNYCNSLAINRTIFNLTVSSASGERARPRAQRVAPRGPHQKHPAI